MNRVIKFRAWDGIDHMSNPFTLQDVQNGVIQFASDSKVMQFTGLHDKHGKEIYEGDIVKGQYGEKEIVELRKFYNYNSEGGCEGFGWATETDIEKCEVIGNIYENPELLKGNQRKE